jgi:SAM-dependent methyltransferase
MGYYERFNEIYNEKLDGGWSFQEIAPQIDEFLNDLQFDKKINHTSTILDLGCGRGRLLKYLKSEQFTNVYGVDISLTATKSANQINHTRKVTVADGVESLPFKTGSFQLVTELTVLSSLNPIFWPKTLNEIKRVLTKDGYFISEMFSRNQNDNASNNYLDPLNNRSKLPLSLDQVYGVIEPEIFTIFSQYFSIIDCKPDSQNLNKKRFFVLSQNNKK